MGQFEVVTPPSSADVDPGAVREHLSAIGASSGFANSDRLTRFLQFTVEAKLRGDEDRIKEFVLGREVFDRGEDFDPRLDPIVRVEARRLRRRLEEYYAGDGRSASLRIEFPKGSYVPLIHLSHGAVAASAFPRRRLWPWLAAPAGVLAILVARRYRPVAVPTVAVVPAQWVFDPAPGSAAASFETLEAALCEAVTAELAGDRALAVKGWPLVAAGRSSAPRDWKRLSLSLNVDQVMVISARDAGVNRGPRITAFLLVAGSGIKKWVGEFEGPAGAGTPSSLRQIAARIAAGSREHFLR